MVRNDDHKKQSFLFSAAFFLFLSFYFIIPGQLALCMDTVVYYSKQMPLLPPLSALLLCLRTAFLEGGEDQELGQQLAISRVIIFFFFFFLVFTVLHARARKQSQHLARNFMFKLVTHIFTCILVCPFLSTLGWRRRENCCRHLILVPFKRA